MVSRYVRIVVNRPAHPIFGVLVLWWGSGYYGGVVCIMVGAVGIMVR